MSLLADRAKLGRFILVGLSLTAIHMGLGAVLLKLVALPPLFASLLAYLGAATCGYLGHRVVTFRARTSHGFSAPRFAAMTALGLLVSWLSLRAAEGWLGIDPLYGVVAAACLVPVVNYVVMDRIVFPLQN
jgi:putative flippase GtrA